MVGVRLPIVPMSHQYVVTEAFLERRDRPLPTLRDPDLLVYFRQEVDGLVMGGYERTPSRGRPTPGPTTPSRADFNGRLLPEVWDRFEEITANSQVRVPAMADVGLRKVINGPEAFTPDNEFLLGETEVDGFFVAAGFCAHGIAGAGGIGKVMAEWIVAGRPRAWTCGTWTCAGSARSTARRRTRWPAPWRPTRPTTTSSTPARSGRPAARCAPARPTRGTSSTARRSARSPAGSGSTTTRATRRLATSRGGRGLGRPALVAGDRRRARRDPRGGGAVRRVVVRQADGHRPDAASLLEWVCDNRVPAASATSRTPRRSTRAGRIESDFTVTRVADDEFLVVTGTAFGDHDAALAPAPGPAARRRRARRRRHRAAGQLRALGAAQPRDLLRGLTGADLSNAAFPFMTAQEITRRRRAGARAAGDVRRRARLGALRPRRVRPRRCGPRCGRRAASTAWSPAATARSRACGWRRATGSGAPTSPPRPTPYEAGLGFCVKLDKPGGFEGRDALVAAKEQGLSRRLLLPDARRPAGGRRSAASRSGSAARSSAGSPPAASATPSTRRSPTRYLPVDVATPGTAVEVNVFGDWVAGAVSRPAAGRPDGTRVRADG